MTDVEAIEKKLDAQFPTKNLLNVTEVSAYTGMSKNFCKKYFGIGKDSYIDKAALARKIVGRTNETVEN